MRRRLAAHQRKALGMGSSLLHDWQCSLISTEIASQKTLAMTRTEWLPCNAVTFWSETQC